MAETRKGRILTVLRASINLKIAYPAGNVLNIHHNQVTMVTIVTVP